MNHRVVKNATWIIGCKVLEAVLHLAIIMLTARYLGPANYGLINYAASIIAFAVPVMHLGVRSILVQELVNLPEKKGETLGTAFFMNVLSSFLCIIGVIAFVSIANPDEPETILVCALYSTTLVFQAVEILQYWFQERLLSKYVSLSMLFAYLVTTAYQVVLLVLGKNIYWFAVAETIRHVVTAILLMILYRIQSGDKLRVSVKKAKQMLSRSKHYILSNLMITIFAQTDKIMLKQMIGAEVTGYYSAAVMCATMSNFVFLAIVDSARPVIFQARIHSKKQFERKLTILYSFMIWLSIAQCLVFTLFSDLIIQILYGADYMPASMMLKVVVWYSTFAHLNLVRDIWILSEEKQHLLWKINICGALANVLMNALLIPFYGGMGAAIASLVTQFFVTIGISAVIKDLRYNNHLLLKGFNPNILIDLLKKGREGRT